MEILAIEGLTKNFYLHNLGKTIKSCRDIGFTLHEGEFIGIVGRSGAGKSSILKCINRTYLPLQGTIVYNSQAFGPIDLAQADERQMLQLRRYEIGYVAQFLNVMPRTTAKEHVMSALLEIGVAAGEAERRAKEMLDYFRLQEELWDIYPQTFSGGERLRLNLAEPTASLDNKTKVLVKDILQQLKEEKTSMLGIFHDLEFMEGVCDKVFNMSEGSFA